MIEKLWIYPPLAHARLGSSEHPLENFVWGPNDESVRGTGKTTIVPAVTLDVDEEGNVSARLPKEIKFRDTDPDVVIDGKKRERFRPACPFFEIHGSWTINGEAGTGPITLKVLEQCGLEAKDVVWTIELGNLKPYHYSLLEGDRIEAKVTITGDDTTPKPLNGITPAGAKNPLVPVGKAVPLGKVQLTKPLRENPDLQQLKQDRLNLPRFLRKNPVMKRVEADLTKFRLRFTPGGGHAYGPTNLYERSTEYNIPKERRFLNPKAGWPQWNPNTPGNDDRTNPGGLYAMDAASTSLGLGDDSCDGLVTCEIAGVKAYARVTAGPQDFQPDRRHVVSIADGLKDRVDRLDVFEPSYMEGKNWGLTELEVRNLMEKVYETMGAMNLDMQNYRSQLGNTRQGMPGQTAEDMMFKQMPARQGHDLPLTEKGRSYHRRFVSYQVFKDMLKKDPQRFKKWIRDPYGSYQWYTRQMPAMMRGSDAYPLALTRRQYDFLKTWLDRVLEQDKDTV